MEGIRLDQELVLKTSSGSNRCEFESHTFFILAYSVTVSTKHFDCFSLGSNPGKPTNNSGSRGVRFISLALDARVRRFESCLPDKLPL